MEILSEAMNTYDPALEVLHSQGYHLSGDFDEDRNQTWVAERGDIRLSGGTPLALLGLAMLWQCRGTNWRRRTGTSLYDRILDGEMVPPGS